MKNRKDSKIGAAFKSSTILNAFINFSGFLYKKLISSFLGFLFTSYDGFCKKFNDSFLIRFFKKILPSSEKKLNFKIKFSLMLQSSCFVKFIKNLIRFLICMPIRMYGAGIFSFGLISSIVLIIKSLLNERVMSDIWGIILGISLMIVAIPIVLSKNVLHKSILNSFCGGNFMINVAGFAPLELDIQEEHNKGGYICFLFGMLMGILTILVDPIFIILSLSAVILIVLIFNKPEFGCIVLIFSLPFVPTMVLCTLVWVIAFAYIIKLCCGKRTLKLEAIDFFVFLFILVILFGGIVSANPSISIKSSLVYITFMLAYFMIANMIRTEKNIKRFIWAFIISSFIAVLVGIYQNFFAAAETIWHDQTMFSDIGIRVVSTFENPNVFAEFIILSLPIFLSVLLRIKRFSGKIIVLFMLAAYFAALIFTWSRGAWIGIIISLFVFFLFYSKKTIVYYSFALLFSPLLLYVVPASIIQRITSIGNLADTSSSYRLNIWRGVIRMLDNFSITGIGIGEGAFKEVYPAYSLSGIETAPHSHNLFLQINVEVGIIGVLLFCFILFLFAQKCFSYLRYVSLKNTKTYALGAFCSILAIAVQGLTDYSWYNYRIFLLFWIVCGLLSAITKIKPEKENFYE